MTLSLIRIKSGQLNASKDTLTLTAEYLRGEPTQGDVIFLKDQHYGIHSYVIEKIQKPLFGKYITLTAGFTEHEVVWENWISEQLKKDSSAICGISQEAYQDLTIEGKLDYFHLIVEFIGFGRVPAFLRSNVQTAARMVPNETEKAKDSIGLSKLGGLPLAHADFLYPKGKSGKSALFLCQIHIKEFKWLHCARQFNGTGILYFFANVYESDDFAGFDELIGIYSEEPVTSTTIQPPDDIINYGTFSETGIALVEEINIPPFETLLWGDDELSKEEQNSYYSIESILEQYKVLKGPKLLGHPYQIQGCVLLESELKQSKQGWYDGQAHDEQAWKAIVKQATPGARTWRMLFELDAMDEYFKKLSGFNGVFNEHADGCYYLMIKQEDLNSMRFSSCESLYQST